MRSLFLILFLLALQTHVKSQTKIEEPESRPLNGIGVNLLGNGALGSLQYERIVSLEKGGVISIASGIGYSEEMQFCIFGGCNKPRQYAIVPIRATANIGGEKHFGEFGLGSSILFGNSEQPIVFYPILGYRILPIKKHRLGFQLNVELPLGSNLSGNSGSIFILGGALPFMPVGFTFSYWI